VTFLLVLFLSCLIPLDSSTSGAIEVHSLLHMGLVVHGDIAARSLSSRKVFDCSDV
jgi:hypothetical protein